MYLAVVLISILVILLLIVPSILPSLMSVVLVHLQVLHRGRFGKYLKKVRRARSSSRVVRGRILPHDSLRRLAQTHSLENLRNDSLRLVIA